MTGSLAKMASLERGVTLMDMPEANEYLMDPGYMECVADILDHPVFQSMDQYIQHGTTTCKCHCIQVSYLAYKLCKRFGGNWRSAARAGLLHDLFYTTGTRTPGKQEIISMALPTRGQPWKMQKQYFELTDEEKDTILRHMWPLTPVPPSTRAGYAVTFADKMCCLEETKATVKRYAAVPGHLLFAQTAERGKF